MLNFHYLNKVVDKILINDHLFVMNGIKKSSSNLSYCLLKPFRWQLLSLKCLVTSVAIVSTPVLAEDAEATAEAKPTLVIGSEVNLPSLTEAVWVKGEGPTSFEDGKVYVVECWATWCGPCIGMIPHVNHLHKKYYDKGLRVYGISVWEDDKEMVEKFVEKKGDEMAYPVAFTGRGSAFEKEWLTASGAKSIPHAFIVKNGKLVGSTQAARITDSLIESLLSGDEGTKKASEMISSANANQEASYKLNTVINGARLQKDHVKMEETLKELKALDPGNPDIGMQELWILIVKKQWTDALTALNELPESESKTNFISITGQLTRKKHEHSADFLKARIKLYSDYVMDKERKIGPNHFGSLSMLQWNDGDKEQAVITANKSIEAAKNSGKYSEPYTKSFERFAKSVNEGYMPSDAEFSSWKREEFKKSREAK